MMWAVKISIPILAITVLFLQGCHGQETVIVNSITNILADNLSWKPYDCARYPGSCNGGICQTDGLQCNSCPGGTNAPYCNPDPIAITACADGCNGIGTCYLLNGLPTCLCNDLRRGSSCNKFRGFVRCSSASMSVQIFPQISFSDSFSGLIGVQKRGSVDLVQDAACLKTSASVTTEGGSNSDVIPATFSTLLDSVANPCHEALTLTNITQNGMQLTKACYTVRIQYNPIFQAASDETLRVCCEENAALGNVTFSTGDSDGGTFTANLSSSVSVVESSFVWTSDKTPLAADTSTQIGDLISYQVSLKSGARYDGIRIESCDVYLNDQYVRVVENRCPLPTFSNFILNIVNGTSLGGQPATFVNIRSIRPNNGFRVNMNCSTSVCIGCEDPTDCSNFQSQNFGRKKRQVADEEDRTFQTSAYFLVGIGSSNRTPCPVQTPCKTTEHIQSVFLPVAIVFGVLLIIALAMSVFVCLRYRSREEEKATSKPPKAYFNASMT